MESWSQKNMEDVGIDVNFVQDNQSFTAHKGTIRGIHYQQNPMAQAKLVRVVRGAVVDVAVDIRKGSPTYGQWTAVELSAENKKQFYGMTRISMWTGRHWGWKANLSCRTRMRMRHC